MEQITLAAISERLSAMEATLNYLADRKEKEGDVDREFNQSQAAVYLGTSPQTVMRLRLRGELHPRLVGERWKFLQKDLDKYIKRNSL